MNAASKTALVILALMSPVACTQLLQQTPAPATKAAAKVPSKEAVIRHILELPANRFHEESVESFRNRLEKEGKYIAQPETGTALMWLDGDGTCGHHIFRVDAQGTLLILEHNWETENPAEQYCLYSMAAKADEPEYLGYRAEVPAEFSPADKLCDKK